jgi:hypothetical protein
MKTLRADSFNLDRESLNSVRLLSRCPGEHVIRTGDTLPWDAYNDVTSRMRPPGYQLVIPALY